MSHDAPEGGEYVELLPKASDCGQPEITLLAGERDEVAALWLRDRCGNRWLYVPALPEEMAEIDAEALQPRP